jgi:hypothetical protein
MTAAWHSQATATAQARQQTNANAKKPRRAAQESVLVQAAEKQGRHPACCLNEASSQAGKAPQRKDATHAQQVCAEKAAATTCDCT